MKKLFTLNRLITFAELALLFLGILTTFLYYVHFHKVFGNTASRLLLALGPILHLGRPYTDLWEFAPPGFLSVATVWIKLFGWSMASLKLLQVVVLTTIGLSFLAILKKVFKSKLLEIGLFFSFVFIFYSPVLQSDILSIELFGLMFSLLGLVVVLYLQKPTLKIALAAALFFLASQMKETYTFTILALVPYCLHYFRKEGFWALLKSGLVALIGILLVGGAMFGYLYSVGGIPGYRQVLEYKLTKVAPIKNFADFLYQFYLSNSVFEKSFLHWQNYATRLLILTAISLLIVYYRYFQVKIKEFSDRTIEFNFRINRGLVEKKERWPILAVLLYSLGLISGVIMYGIYSVDARQIPVSAAVLLLVGTLLKTPIITLYKFWGNRNKIIINLVLASFLFFLLAPQTRIVNAFFNQIKLHISGVFFADLESQRVYVRTSTDEINRYIASKTSSNDCILNPYGWEIAETYIYSRRRPCSRHFIVNLALGTDWQLKEYKKQLFTNPPKAIFYNTNIVDINIPDFEKNVINYSDILKNCYIVDDKYQDYPYQISGSFVSINLYWAKPNLSKEELRSCFKNNSKYVLKT